MDLSDVTYQISTSIKKIKNSLGIRPYIDSCKQRLNQSTKKIEDNHLDPSFFYTKNFNQNDSFVSNLFNISRTWDDIMRETIQIALSRYGYKNLKELCYPMCGFGTSREDDKDKVIEEFIADFWKDFRNMYFNNQGNLDDIPTIAEIKRFYRQELKEAKLCLKANQDV